MQETVYDRCSSHHLYSLWIKQSAKASSHGTSVKSNYELLFCPCMQAIIKSLQDPCSINKLCVHGKGYIVSRLHRLYLNLVVRRDYSSPGRTGSTSTLSCAASTRLSAAAALHRLRRTPPRRRLLGVRLLRLLTSTSKLVEGGYYVINN
jgi:hypothetical protein